MLKHLSKIVAVFAIAAVIMPSMALAHGNNDNGRRGRDGNNRGRVSAWVENDFGVKVFDPQNKSNSSDDEDKNDDKNWHLGDHGFISNLFYNGTVTARSGSNLIIETKDGSTFTVDASSAAVIQIPRKAESVSDINEGDAVHITGTKTDSDSIDASVVYVMPANLKPAIAKGTVTAVNETDNTITVQTKDDGTTITVNADNDTKITDTNDDGNGDLADVEVGMTAKLAGFWDSVLNVFNALKVKLS